MPAQPRRQLGTAVVEMAVVLPVLLLLTLGVTEIGRILFQYNAMTKAGRDAVRYLSNEATFGSTDIIQLTNTITGQTKNLAVYGNIDGLGTPIVDGLDVGNVTVRVIDPLHVGVDVQFTYIPMFAQNLPTFGIGDGTLMSIDLRSTIIMRAL